MAGVGITADTGTATEAFGATGTTTIRITMPTRPTMDTVPRSGSHSAVDATTVVVVTSMEEVAVVTGAIDAGETRTRSSLSKRAPTFISVGALMLRDSSTIADHAPHIERLQESFSSHPANDQMPLPRKRTS